ncbi:hypothetical protein NUSPORA_01262 [Nucleospora cyclopteri]
MKIKTLLVISLLRCLWSDEYINSKISSIHLIFKKNNFLKYCMPNFYNYDQNMVFENIIEHFKNIIIKSIKLELIDLVFAEYESAIEPFKLHLLSITYNLDVLNECLNKKKSKINIFQRIEINIYLFLYKKIQSIIDFDYDDNILHKVLGNDIHLIALLIVRINNVKKALINDIEIENDVDPNVISFIEETCLFLHEIKNKLKKDFNTNLVLKESYDRYLINLKKSINLKNFDDPIYHYANESITRENLIFLKIQEFYSILRENIMFRYVNFASEVHEKICNILNILVSMTKINFVFLHIDIFTNIYLYYNYLIEFIFLKRYLFKTKISLNYFLVRSYEFDAIEFDKAITLLTIQKKLLGDLITDFENSFPKSKQVELKYKDIRLKNTFLKKYIQIEEFYDNLIKSDFSEDFYLQNKSLMTRSFNNILIYFKNFYCFSHETFIKDFDFFRIQCFIILRLCSFNVCNLKTRKLKHHEILYELITGIIIELDALISMKNNEPLENVKKFVFLDIVLNILNETKGIFDHASEIIKSKSYTSLINQFLLSEIYSKIRLYDIFTDFYSESYSQLSNATLDPKIKKTNEFEVLNCQKNLVQNPNYKCLEKDLQDYKESKYFKLKTYWIKRLNLLENDRLQYC